jgi:hypothetical protein
MISDALAYLYNYQGGDHNSWFIHPKALFSFHFGLLRNHAALGTQSARMFGKRRSKEVDFHEGDFYVSAIVATTVICFQFVQSTNRPHFVL